MNDLILDADDFYQSNNRLDLLFSLKAIIPNLKVSLFTIVGKCSDEFIFEVKKIDWLDMIPHGLLHETSRECENWSYKTSLDYLDNIEKLGLTKGFKAPGWQISDGMYRALLKRGYWVADQAYNNERRPKELKAYILDSSNKMHYHVHNICNNGLEERLEEILKLKGDFKFIKDVI